MEVPEHIDVEVSEMHIGDSFRLAALTPPQGVSFLDDLEETVLATVTQPMREEPVEAEEGAEGEVAEGEAAAGEAAAEGEADAGSGDDGEPGTTEG